MDCPVKYAMQGNVSFTLLCFSEQGVFCGELVRWRQQRPTQQLNNICTMASWRKEDVEAEREKLS